MPAKDKYHDSVVRALQKEGWEVVRENVPVGDRIRQLFIDILARRSEDEALLIEVKVFEGLQSPVVYLQRAIGQYMMYVAVLDYIGSSLPLVLAIPLPIYEGLLSEEMIAHAVDFLKIKLLVFDPVKESIVRWHP